MSVRLALAIWWQILNLRNKLQFVDREVELQLKIRNPSEIEKKNQEDW